MISLRERFQKLSRRQHLQRRIDLLGSSTHPYGRARVDSPEKAWIEAFQESEEVQDAIPIGSSEVAAAIAEAFRRGPNVANLAPHRSRIVDHLDKPASQQ
jgi:hypothetical protein